MLSTVIVSAGEVSDAGDVLQALWDAAGGVWDPKRVPGPEEISLVKAAFFVHVAERVVCEPCGNKVTHTKDFYEQVICASATSIRRCQQVRSPGSTPSAPFHTKTCRHCERLAPSADRSVHGIHGSVVLRCRLLLCSGEQPVRTAAYVGAGLAQRDAARQQDLRHGCGRLRPLLPCAELRVRACALVLCGAPGLGAPTREP